MFQSAKHAHGYAGWQVACLLASTGCLFQADAGSKPAQPVSIYLNVEKDGGLVTGLTEKNFRLSVDSKPQPFRLETPEPGVSVAFLAEYSRASTNYLDDLNECMAGFREHAPEGYWYALAAFSHQLEVVADFTRQTGEITDAYSRLGGPVSSEIDVYDAVYEMLDKMGQLPGRRILVVLASGVDTFSEHKLDEVQKKAESENVTIFVAGLGSLFRGSASPFLSSPGSLRLSQAMAFLQMLARKTGGFAWFPYQATAFPDVIAGVVQSIATQYRLAYQPPPRNANKFQKITVEAFRIIEDKREDFKVLAREGWR